MPAESARLPRLPHLLLDLGDVLVSVDQPRLAGGLAELTGRPLARVEEVLFTRGLKRALDLGTIEATAAWRRFCAELDASVSYQDFAHTYCDLFDTITPTQDLVRALRAAGHRAYLLSNTDILHLTSIQARWELVRTLDATVASFELGVVKPDPRFFELALQQLGLSANECVFVDDRADNVASAQSVGLRAVQAIDPDAVRAGLVAALDSFGASVPAPPPLPGGPAPQRGSASG